MNYRKMSRNLTIALLVVAAILILVVQMTANRPELQPSVTKWVYAFIACAISVSFVRMILQEKANEEETSTPPKPYQKLRWGITAAYCISGMMILLALGYAVDHPEVHLPYGTMLGVFLAAGVVVLGLTSYWKNKKQK